MASIREMLDLKNCSIKFTTYEGDYEGVVRLVSPISEKITIENVFFLPDKIYMGTLTFLCREISNCAVLNRPGNVDEEKAESFSYRRHYDSCKADVLMLLDDFDVASVDSNFEQEYLEEDYKLKLPPGFNNVPLDVVTVDNFGQEFDEAVNHIKSEISIAVSLEGPKLGRHGIISWLCLSTSCCTFMFDVQELGKATFEKGLREIFENPKIRKVIHDCREVSDCLFHMFGTKLVNVFDTQVADKLVTMQQSNDCKFSQQVSSLNTCLRKYLNVPEKFLYHLEASQSYKLCVISFQLRPPKHELKDLMLKNVIYLRLLSEKLESALLNPFQRAVEVYLQVLQCLSDQELLLENSQPDQLPLQLVLEGIQVVRFRNHIKVPGAVASGMPCQKTKSPFQEFLERCRKYEKNISKNMHNTFFGSCSPVELTKTEIEEETNSTSSTVYQNCNQHFNLRGSDLKVNGTFHQMHPIAMECNISKNSKLSENSTIHDRASNYSLHELDEKFSCECSKISLEDEESSAMQTKKSVGSSKDGSSDDLWAIFHADSSKYYSMNENKPDKSQFIPAGKE